MIGKPRQFQLIFLTVNYALLIWLIVCLKEDGYFDLFIFLIVMLSVERFLNILKSFYILLFNIGYYSFLIAPLINIFCCDISLGYDIDDDYLMFFKRQFYRQVSYIAHYLNLVPLTVCFAVFNSRNQQDFPQIVYPILIIYGLIYVALAEIHILLQKSEQIKNSIPRAIWRFIEGICRFGCFCACLGELLSVSLWFLWLLVLFIPLEIYEWYYISPNSYLLFSSFQNQLFSSAECLGNKNKYAEYHLFNNTYQSIFIIIIFTIRTLIHPYSKIYDIILYIAFCVYLPEAVSSIICAVKYMKYGPFNVTFNQEQRGKNTEEIVKNLEVDLNNIIKAAETNYLTERINIINQKQSEDIFSAEKYYSFIFNVMSAISKNRKPAQLVVFQTVNANRWTTKLNIYNTEVTFFFSQDNQFEDAELIIQKIQDFLLIPSSSQSSPSYFKFILSETFPRNTIIRYSLNRTFINQVKFIKPDYITLPNIPIDYQNQLFHEILLFISNKKLIFDLLPAAINPSAYMYDLYEDNLK